MFEEPFRFVEAIANRREYIENELAGGSPLAALTFDQGILLFTIGRDRQKLFEVYDRIALGALGHPGDIERLRMLAIELASTEGFTRSAADVSLRRLVNYSLSPTLKAAFEQIYGPPFLARLLFAELGATDQLDQFLRVDFDGAIRTNGNPALKSRPGFGVLSATKFSEARIETFLSGAHRENLSLAEALGVARDAWVIGHLALASKDEIGPEVAFPAASQIQAAQAKVLENAVFEAAILDRTHREGPTYRTLDPSELAKLSD
jgi:proteasome alpha subunit